MISNINWPAAVLAVRNRIAITCQADPAWQAYGDYYITLVIRYEPTYQSGFFEEVLRLQFRAIDSARGCAWEVSALLEGLLSPDIPTGPSANLPTRLEKSMKRVQFTLIEKIDGVSQTPLSSPILQVCRAGFGSYTGQALFAHAITMSKWLTHQPNPKLSNPYQPEWLCMITPSIQGIILYCEAYFPDGSSVILTPFSTSPAGTYELWRFPVSYADLGLGLQAQEVIAWEVWAEQGGIQTERLRYELDPWDCTVIPRHYIWEGSLGTWHSLRSTGESTEQAEVISTKVTRVNPIGDPGQTLAQRNTRYSRSAQQYSGYLPAGHAAWLLDMLISEEVYRVGREWTPNPLGTGDLQRIQVERESFTLRQDNEFLDKIEFSYRDAVAHRGL